MDGLKKLAVKVTDAEIIIRLMGGEKALKFAAPKKKKNCTKGISCGNSCISASRTCRKPLSPGQVTRKKKIIDSAKKNKQSSPESAQKEASTPEQKALESASELKKNNPSISESDFAAKANLILKIESQQSQSEGDEAHKSALVAKIDPQSSEAALDRVNSLYRARNEIQKKGQLSEGRLRDIPHDFGQGMRGGSVHAINLASAAYTAEIWDSLSEPAKNKFVEHWQEYSRGRNVSEQLGKNSGFTEVLKSKKVKAFVDEVDQRIGAVNA